MKLFMILTTLGILSGCLVSNPTPKKGIDPSGSGNSTKINTPTPSSVATPVISAVDFSDNVITITGTNLSSTIAVYITDDSSDSGLELEIESISLTQIKAKAKVAMAFAMQTLYRIALNTASAQVVVPITFTLDDGSVGETTIEDMGATNGQVLKWDAVDNKWVASDDIGAGVAGTGTITAVTYSTGLVDVGTVVSSGGATIKVDVGTEADQIPVMDSTGTYLSLADKSLALISTGPAREFRIYNDLSTFRIYDQTDGATRLSIDNTGDVDISEDLTVTGSGNFIGGLQVNGTDVCVQNGACVVAGMLTAVAAGTGITVTTAGGIATVNADTGTAVGNIVEVIATGNIDETLIPAAIDAVKIGDASVDNTEFQRLDGLTDDIATLLGNKEDSLAAGSMAYQLDSAVAITGGTIAGATVTSPSGTFTTATISGGTINNTSIVSASGTFTTVNIDGGTIDGVTLNVAAGTVSTLTASTANISTSVVTGDATFDVDTLFVDSTNNNVGIGTTTPSDLLEVSNPAAATGGIKISGNLEPGVTFAPSGASGEEWRILAPSGATALPLGSLLFYNQTDAATRMILSSTGLLGVGTTTPGSLIDVAGTLNGSDILRLQDDGAAVDGAVLAFRKNTASPAANDISGVIAFRGRDDVGVDIVDYAKIDTVMTDVTDGAHAGELTFSTTTAGALAEKMRITDDGNIGIGNTAPTQQIHVQNDLASNIMLIKSAGDFETGIRTDSNRSTVDDVLGGISSYWNSTRVGGMQVMSGDDTTNKDESYLTFYTRDDGAVDWVERVRVTKDGNMGIGVTTPTTTLQVAGVITPSTDNTHSLGSATNRFSVVYAANAAINTSDGRHKSNIKESDLGLDFILNMNPVSYTWKKHPERGTFYGVIAQELEEQLDGKEFAGLDYNKEADLYGVRYTEFISPIVKAIQELKTWIDKTFSSQDREIASLKETIEHQQDEIDLLRKDLELFKKLLQKK